MSIIGISGKIGAGKDTLADLIKGVDSEWEIKSFAYNVKMVCALITGVPMSEQLSRHGKNQPIPGDWGFTVGQLQQHVGTVLREIDRRIWIKSLFADYHSVSKWIITDLRFANEAQAVRDRGGYLVRIDGSRTGPQGRDPNHISETELDSWEDWDCRFDNTHLTLGQLQEWSFTIRSNI